MSYTVHSGDTLSSIANKFHVSLAALEHANPQIHNPNLIYVGESIKLPGDGFSSAPPPSSASSGSYTVRSGDSMSAIASRFHLSLAALEHANPQVTNPNQIYVGQKLHIPGLSGGSAPAPTPAPSSGSHKYTVRSGDTMSSIASRFGVSLSALEHANPQVSNPNRINVGQVLNIPGGGSSAPSPSAPPVSGSAGLDPNKMPAQYRQWIPYVEAAARAYDLPPALIFAVMSRETNGRNVVGDGGHGRGLMQIDDRSWGSWLSANGGGMDPASNIMKGAAILRANINYFGGNVRDGVAAYNCGPGNVSAALRNGLSPDAYTTGHNYSADVLSRESMFV